MIHMELTSAGTLFYQNSQPLYLNIGDCQPKIIDIDQCLMKLFENIRGVPFFEPQCVVLVVIAVKCSIVVVSVNHQMF